MTLFEATYLVKREYNGHRMKDSQLADAIVVYQDAIEDLKRMQWDRRHRYDMANTECRVGLSYEPVATALSS